MSNPLKLCRTELPEKTRRHLSRKFKTELLDKMFKALSRERYLKIAGQQYGGHRINLGWMINLSTPRFGEFVCTKEIVDKYKTMIECAPTYAQPDLLIYLRHRHFERVKPLTTRTDVLPINWSIRFTIDDQYFLASLEGASGFIAKKGWMIDKASIDIRPGRVSNELAKKEIMSQKEHNASLRLAVARSKVRTPVVDARKDAANGWCTVNTNQAETDRLEELGKDFDGDFEATYSDRPFNLS